ncbi:MAG: hypothetical protein H6719_00270 [Sandaracinaceae bacterium]|nr:hypothetical protein [Sandaracinaceae bacterium]
MHDITLAPEPEDGPDDTRVPRVAIPPNTVVGVGSRGVLVRRVRVMSADGETREILSDQLATDRRVVRIVLCAEPVSATSIDIWILEGYRDQGELRFWVSGGRYDLIRTGRSSTAARRENKTSDALVLGTLGTDDVDAALSRRSVELRTLCFRRAIAARPAANDSWAIADGTAAALDRWHLPLRAPPSLRLNVEQIQQHIAIASADLIVPNCEFGGVSRWSAARDSAEGYANAVSAGGVRFVPRLPERSPRAFTLIRRYRWNNEVGRGHLVIPDTADLELPRITWQRTIPDPIVEPPGPDRVRLLLGRGEVRLRTSLCLGSLKLSSDTAGTTTASTPSPAEADAWLDFLNPLSSSTRPWLACGHGFHFVDAAQLAVLASPVAADRRERSARETLVIPVESAAARWERLHDDDDGLECRLTVSRASRLSAIVIERRPFALAQLTQAFEGGDELATYSRTQRRWEFTTRTGEVTAWLPSQAVGDRFYDAPPLPDTEGHSALGTLTRAILDRTHNPTPRTANQNVPASEPEPGTAETPWDLGAHLGRRRDGTGILLRELDAEFLLGLRVQYRVSYDAVRLADAFAMAGHPVLPPIERTQRKAWRDAWMRDVLDDRNRFERRLGLARTYEVHAPIPTVLSGAIKVLRRREKLADKVSDFRHAIPDAFAELLDQSASADLCETGVSSLGGWVQQVATFADGRVVVRCKVVMGRVHAYSVEIPGRLKECGHLARCVIEMGLKLEPSSATEAAEWPFADVVLNKLRIHLDEPTRNYDDEGSNVAQPVCAIGFPHDGWDLPDLKSAYVENGFWRVPLPVKPTEAVPVAVTLERPGAQRADLPRTPGPRVTVPATFSGLDCFEASVVVEHGRDPNGWPHVATGGHPVCVLALQGERPVIDLARRGTGCSFPASVKTISLSRSATKGVAVRSDVALDSARRLLERIIDDWTAPLNSADDKSLLAYARAYQATVDTFEGTTTLRQAARKAAGTQLDDVRKALSALETASDTAVVREQASKATQAAAEAIAGLREIEDSTHFQEFTGNALYPIEVGGAVSGVEGLAISETLVYTVKNGVQNIGGNLVVRSITRGLPLQLKDIPVTFEGRFVPGTTGELGCALWPSGVPLYGLSVSLDVDGSGAPSLRIKYANDLANPLRSEVVTAVEPRFDAELGVRADGGEVAVQGLVKLSAKTLHFGGTTKATALVSLDHVALKLDHRGRFSLSTGRVSFEGLLKKINDRLSEATQGMVGLALDWAGNKLTLAMTVARDSVKAGGVELFNLYTRIAPSFDFRSGDDFDVGFDLAIGRPDARFAITYSNLGGDGYLSYSAKSGALQASIGLIATLGFSVGPLSGRASPQPSAEKSG